MMQAAGVLPRRKDGLKIFYAIKHPKILEIADTLALIAKHEFGGGHELLKVVRADLPDREDPSFRQNLNALEDIMKIELLCTSCARCTSLYENVRKAIEESGKKVELVKVEDIPSITKYGVMSMPALVIDGQVKFSGKVASVAEIKEML